MDTSPRKSRSDRVGGQIRALHITGPGTDSHVPLLTPWATISDRCCQTQGDFSPRHAHRLGPRDRGGRPRRHHRSSPLPHASHQPISGRVARGRSDRDRVQARRGRQCSRLWPRRQGRTRGDAGPHPRPPVAQPGRRERRTGTAAESASPAAMSGCPVEPRAYVHAVSATRSLSCSRNTGSDFSFRT